MSTPKRPSALRSAAVIFLGLFAVMIAIAIAKKTGHLDYDLAKRGVGMALGVMLVAAGNLLPKFHLFHSPRREARESLAAERFAGWVFVVAGVAYLAVWALAPMATVMLISSLVGLTAFALVAIDLLRRRGATVPQTKVGQVTEENLAKRLLLATILLTLGWAVVIFLADHIGGDAAARWCGIAYVIVLPALLPLMVLRRLGA